MPHRYVWRKTKDFFIYSVLHVDDTPHRIALSVAFGVFMAWLPCIGLQMIGVLTLATVFRANKVVGLPFVWISNPLTLPMYVPNFWIGCALLPGDYSTARFLESLGRAVSTDATLWNRFRYFWQATIDVFWPLWAGSIIVASVLGVVAYFLIRWAVITYRAHRQARLARKEQREETHAVSRGE